MFKTHHDEFVAVRPDALFVFADLGGPLGPDHNVVPGVGEYLDVMTPGDLPQADGGQSEAEHGHTRY